MGSVQVDVPVPPGCQPGDLVAARRAQRADGLLQRHHSVNEGCQQPRLALPGHQDLV